MVLCAPHLYLDSPIISLACAIHSAIFVTHSISMETIIRTRRRDVKIFMTHSTLTKETTSITVLKKKDLHVTTIPDVDRRNLIQSPVSCIFSNQF